MRANRVGVPKTAGQIILGPVLQFRGGHYLDQLAQLFVERGWKLNIAEFGHAPFCSMGAPQTSPKTSVQRFNDSAVQRFIASTIIASVSCNSGRPSKAPRICQ